MRLEVGATFYRYELLSLLGEGGMARVYRVRHQQLGTEHALKVLVSASLDVRERLLHEGRVQASLKHPNIVNVTDVINVEGLPGLIMELVDGPTLQELLTNRRLTVQQVDLLGTGVLRGVAFAHRKRLIHRDLKPANILCQVSEGTLVPKVADFGLVKVVEGDGAGMHNTRSGMMMGTPHYMSPEQIRDSKRVDERADVWALGVILYRMSTGSLPFEGESVFDVMTAASAGAFQPVLEVAPDLPERMAQTIEAALQVKPEDRPIDAAALLRMWTGAGAVPGQNWADDLVSGYTKDNEPFHSEEVMSDATLSGMYQPDSQDKPIERPPAVTLAPMTQPPSEQTWTPEPVRQTQQTLVPAPPQKRASVLPFAVVSSVLITVVALWFAGVLNGEDETGVVEPSPEPVVAVQPIAVQPTAPVEAAQVAVVSPSPEAAPARKRPLPKLKVKAPPPVRRPTVSEPVAAQPQPDVEAEGTDIEEPSTAEVAPLTPTATRSSFSVKGDAYNVYVRRADEYRYDGDDVEPKTWELFIQARESSQITRIQNVAFVEGEKRVFNCSAASGACR